ncbi:tetratricopeptide repeat-containing diguanylate cyclase [Shewanella sp. MBTL60-007]|uniref:tetratricopeptide repeat-containing diguanylate cyclase n=1 Tax=Shewanella sp. MBTL60-007 TaxID=2815911 RepID=UPI001BBCDA79|nr:tetratricopeptide repeat-containing diguanylate cyclase [Shewanella sp. MBTL60-007]GIU16045.1 GGDEF domain-containing protein [Shewanella sp. MBTL60-007]
MPKPFLLIKIILLLGLPSVSALGYAEQSYNDKADAIFKLLDSGTIEKNATTQAYLDELNSLISATDIQRQLRLTRARCWAFNVFEEGQVSKGLAFAQQALNNPNLANSPNDKLDLELCQAWLTEQDGDVDLALAGYNAAITQAYALEDLRLVADARGMRGYLHSYQGNFTQGLEDLLTSHALYQSLDLSAWARTSLYEIATIYRRLGDQKSAIRYFKKLEKSYLKSNNLDGANAITVAIAIAEEELGNLDRAKLLFEQGYHHWKNNNRELEQATVAVNIAGTLIKLGEFKQASQYLDEAEPFILPTDEAFYSFMHLFRAQIYLGYGLLPQTHKSIAYARSAFSRVKNLRGLAQLQLVESQAFLQEGRWKQAYYALSEYVKLRNELDAKQLSSYTTEMRTRFNANQIEEENRHLIENQQLKELELAMLEQNKLQQWIIIILGSFLMLIISVFAYKQIQKNRLLSALALTDDLTQLPNRRYIYAKAQSRFEEAQRTQQPLSVILFDADYFKLINDKHGHEVGDQALVLLAQTCRNLLSHKHQAARVGGEEFLILLADSDMAQAYEIAQALVKRVSESNFSAFPQGFTMTISAGVASMRAEDSKLSQLLKRADDALYQAKSQGRNQAKGS